MVWDGLRSTYTLLCRGEDSGSFFGPQVVKGLRVLELGSGSGLLGLGCGLLGAREIVLTDLPCHVPRLLENARINDGALAASSVSVKVVSLEWGADDEVTEAAVGPPFDVVLACELLHWPALDLLSEDTIDLLGRTIRQTLLPGGHLIVGYVDFT